MNQDHIIKGFSKLTRREKLVWLKEQSNMSDLTLKMLNSHLHTDPELQNIYGNMSENSVSNFFLPMGLAPNFLINGNLLTLPMVIEESSVVAAASHAAKFWAMHGGFHTEVKGLLKTGQIHFTWTGRASDLQELLGINREKMMESLKPVTGRMEERGGGIEDMRILPGSDEIPGYYQLHVTFLTADAMGANFINSVLENLSVQFTSLVEKTGVDGELEVIMSILSNYTPECRVNCFVEGDIQIFETLDPETTAQEFARRFKLAVDMASHDTYRAVTHNKGIFNGMDAVIMATGNDFRAIEACGHAYASRKGRYESLSSVELTSSSFRFSLEVPLSVGTVGGASSTHPMADISLQILGHPSAEELMGIIASAGLANNFSAIRSLITTGIQKGHMRMHLGNILKQLGASPEEFDAIISRFSKQTVSYSAVRSFLEILRDKNSN